MFKNIFIKVLIKLKLTDTIKEYRKKGVVIGENTHILGSALDSTHPHLIEIGDNCTLTHCVLLTHDASIKKQLGKSIVGKIIIGNNCFIGWGAIILPNVTIGDNCIIGAGAVVAKSIPNNSVVVGNPCKIIKNTNDYMKNHEKLMSSSICFNYNYSEMTMDEKLEQKSKLKRGKIGYDD